MGFEVREPGRTYSGAGLVIDNSVAMRWVVASGKSADQRYALAVRRFVQDKRSQVMVPYLWTYEAANVAAHYVRKGELGYSVAINALHALGVLFTINIDRAETPRPLFEAAESYGVSAYDAAYLLLARGEGLPIATLDRKMRKVAKGMGIEVFGMR
ncbi:MAG: type II toxin-antitoxin system VapC family toxin [Gammaproteobacteria bacterium]|nr:type II toxin-antitoxin system VapC family toxin [Gammaproteobacteria bacterium]MCY4166221.1 type II toxin-antitoxin system VapC family toxin [Gammaproteobacteria bacterium]MCY4341334.1 type II toxin-antitoxin system VapC family toxin [Gammaproteobacteria bacterium]